MNESMNNFRQLQGQQNRVKEVSEALSGIGAALEKAMIAQIDDMPLRHPEIVEKVVELHMLLTYEFHPELEPRVEQKPVDQAPDTP